MFEISADFNDIFSQYKYTTFENGAKHKDEKTSEIWTALHALLNVESLSLVASAKTTIKINPDNTEEYTNSSVDTEQKTWHTFWNGLLSQVIDPYDYQGGSIQSDKLKSALSDASNTNGDNDILASIIQAATNDFSGTNGAGVDIATNPEAKDNLWAAFMIHLIDFFGDEYEKTVLADNDGTEYKLTLKEGDAIALRFEAKEDLPNSTSKFGVIILKQKTT
jgi:hypothetical protein